MEGQIDFTPTELRNRHPQDTSAYAPRTQEAERHPPPNHSEGRAKATSRLRRALAIAIIYFSALVGPYHSSNCQEEER